MVSFLFQLYFLIRFNLECKLDHNGGAHSLHAQCLSSFSHFSAHFSWIPLFVLSLGVLHFVALYLYMCMFYTDDKVESDLNLM